MHIGNRFVHRSMNFGSFVVLIVLVGFVVHLGIIVQAFAQEVGGAFGLDRHHHLNPLVDHLVIHFPQIHLARCWVVAGWFRYWAVTER